MVSQTALTEESLSPMKEEQKRIVLTQWQRHQHETHKVDYDVSGEGDILKGFAVNKGVWDPFLASGRYHARYLFYNQARYGPEMTELGCGTGLMSVVMAKYGNKKVIASDISHLAVPNTRENAEHFGLQDKIEVIQGDLFENVKRKADMITWMIPFFSGNPPKGDTISASMIMPPELFERFLAEAPKYLNKGGVVLVPSFSLGGNLTDPRIVAPKYDYDVKTTWSHKSINGIQQGMIYMHELTLK